MRCITLKEVNTTLSLFLPAPSGEITGRNSRIPRDPEDGSDQRLNVIDILSIVY